MYSSTSFFETRPPSPVPSICEMSTPFSAASFRTAGVALTSDRSGRSAVAVDAEDDADGEGDDSEEVDGVDPRCGGTLSEDDVAEGDPCVAHERADGADAADADEGGRGCDIEGAEDEGA